MLAMGRIAPTPQEQLSRAAMALLSSSSFSFFITTLHVPREKPKEGQSLLEINICIECIYACVIPQER
jgi:hypothetical protein